MPELIKRMLLALLAAAVRAGTMPALGHLEKIPLRAPSPLCSNTRPESCSRSRRPQVRIHLWPIAKLMGYRSYEPDRDTVLVTCCTNGLGHVHQMERVLSVLQEAGLKFPVICLAREQKVPAYKLESLKKRFPDATFVNLNLEIDYDNGKSFNNRQIIWSGLKTLTRRASPFYRKVGKLLRKHRPAYCLSFWEPGVAAFINVMNCPTRLVSVASQGQIYADNTGVEKGLLLRALHQMNVGDRGTLVPLSVRPLEGAIPQVVRVPEVAEPAPEPGYFVAYSTVPQVLGSIRKLSGKSPVRLFVKNTRLSYYTAKFKRYPHIDVRVTSSDFPDQLAKSWGLIASPSRGVVTQAVALGKPVYLFCPRGHLEQEYNLRFYLQRFAGVSCPKTRRYARYFGAKVVGRGRRANFTMPDGFQGQMQSLAEWESSLSSLKLEGQASALRDWLGQTDELIRKRLIPLLQPTPEELAAEAEAEAREREEEAREAAEAAAEVAAAAAEEAEEEGDEDEDEELDEEEHHEEGAKAAGSSPPSDARRQEADAGASGASAGAGAAAAAA
jgi:hypothetical protein